MDIEDNNPSLELKEIISQTQTLRQEKSELNLNDVFTDNDERMSKQMGKLKVISNGCLNVDKITDSQIYTRISHELLKLPGGQELLKDALKLGDITINFSRNAVAGNAHWDGMQRCININYPDDLNLLLKQLPKETVEDDTINEQIEKQYQFLCTLVFELCNATHASFSHKEQMKGPLQFPTAEEFVRENEFIEFKSFQRRAKIWDEAIEKLDWPAENRYVCYEDNEFERYFKEVPNIVQEGYGPQSHADYYRNGYVKAFESVKDVLCSMRCLTHQPFLFLPPAIQIPKDYSFFDPIKLVIKLKLAETIEDHIKICAENPLNKANIQKSILEYSIYSNLKLFGLNKALKKLDIEIKEQDTVLKVRDLIDEAVCDELKSYLHIDDFFKLAEDSFFTLREWRDNLSNQAAQQVEMEKILDDASSLLETLLKFSIQVQKMKPNFSLQPVEFYKNEQNNPPVFLRQALLPDSMRTKSDSGEHKNQLASQETMHQKLKSISNNYNM